MAGKAKRGSKRGPAKKNAGAKNSVKAGLQFPVGRCQRNLKQGRYARQVGVGGGVFLAAVLECSPLYCCKAGVRLVGTIANAGGALTVLVCGLTDALAREGERRFWTSLHRLRDALERRPPDAPAPFEGYLRVETDLKRDN